MNFCPKCGCPYDETETVCMICQEPLGDNTKKGSQSIHYLPNSEYELNAHSRTSKKFDERNTVKVSSSKARKTTNHRHKQSRKKRDISIRKRMTLILSVIAFIGIIGLAYFAVGSFKSDNGYGGIALGECYSPKNENIVFDDSDSGTGYVNNMILVFFRKNTPEDEIVRIADLVGGKIVGKISGINQYQIEIDPTTKNQLTLICKKLEENPNVKFAIIDDVIRTEPNAFSIPNDPWRDTLQGIWGIDWDEEKLSGTNWWIKAGKVLSAWKYSEYFSPINIGIVDNGFDTTHEDLRIRVINSDINSIEKHGTHVAGVIGASINNGIGISGIVENANLICVDCYATKKQEKTNVAVSSLMSGIVTCLDNNCKVINMSSGTPYTNKRETNENAQESAYTTIKYLAAMIDLYDDFIIVQAAGNGNSVGTSVNAQEYGGYFASINRDMIQQVFDKLTRDEIVFEKNITADDIMNSFIVVGAVDKKQIKGKYQLAEFSNYGNTVSVCAPGVDIFSTLPMGGLDGSYGYMDGTSMAAPIVTGIAALAWSVDQTMTAAEVKNIVISTATEQVLSRNKNDTGTYYMVNAAAAIEKAVEHCVAPSEPLIVPIIDDNEDETLGAADNNPSQDNHNPSENSTSSVTQIVTTMNGYATQIDIMRNQENRISEFQRRTHSSSGVVESDYLYRYHSSGQLESQQDVANGYVAVEYLFGNNGQIVSRIEREYPSDYKKYIYEYNGQGQITRTISEDGNSETIYYYDETGKLNKESGVITYGDMSGSFTRMYSYGSNGKLVEKVCTEDWGWGAPTESVYRYRYDYAGFVIEECHTDGSLMYTQLNLDDQYVGDQLQLMLDESAKFIVENGMLKNIIGNSYSYEFYYGSETDRTFDSKIPAVSYSDEITGDYMVDGTDIRISITATSSTDYLLTYSTPEITLENIPLAYFSYNSPTDRRPVFIVSTTYPVHSGAIHVMWDNSSLFPYAVNADIEGVEGTNGDYYSMTKLGVFVPAH